MSESESDLAGARSPVFQIFRANEAPTAEAAEVMYCDDIDPEMQIRIEQLVGGGEDCFGYASALSPRTIRR
jgi:hypothetical protein